jgi:hypothetical protein
VLALAEARAARGGERFTRGYSDARGRRTSSCAEREQTGGREMEEDAPCTHLKERPDGTRYVCVIALRVPCACALSAAQREQGQRC